MTDIFGSIVLAVETDNKIEECKGLYWRGSISQFISSHNSIERRESLRLLKRKSCPGCQYCWWILDWFKEDFPAVPDLKQHQLYTYVVHQSRDWESGHIEVDYIELVEVDDA